MQERSTANSVHGRFASALVLSLLFMTSSWVTAVSDLELVDGTKFNSSSDVQMNLYTMYIASQNSSAGGDGFITTQVPESGGQESMSALSNSVEFRTSPMLSSLEVAGRPNHGSGSGYILG